MFMPFPCESCHESIVRTASAGGSAGDVEMEDLRWAEETASVFGDEAAQMQIDSSSERCASFMAHFPVSVVDAHQEAMQQDLDGRRS